jgi:hypothetical protein
MHHPRRLLAKGICVAMLCALNVAGLAQSKSDDAGAAAQPSRPQFIKGFVVDERLSALRQEADLHAPVLKRLRIGRAVYITSARSGQSEFYRVAVTRRTRGWIHRGAVALPGRVGEDARVMRVIEEASDGLDRIALCQLFLQQFSRSRLGSRALLLLAEAAEGAAASLSQRAHRRLKTLDERKDDLNVADYYLNDPGLDRYSRLRVAFRFDASQTRYAYDGKAYGEILRRYPQSAEAETARRRIALLRGSSGK